MAGLDADVLLEDVLGLHAYLSPCMCCGVNSQAGEWTPLYCDDCIWHMVDDTCIWPSPADDQTNRHDCFPANGCPPAWAAGMGLPLPWEVGMERVR